MGFAFILAGLVFFFNPCVNIFDILPDFLGAILLSIGLYKLSDTEDRFYNARRISNVMIAVYAAKFILSFYLTARWKSGLLPFTFMFSVGEAILFIMFFVSLYGAIEYMANLHDGDRHLSSVNSVSQFTILFSVVKVALAFVPEAFALEKEQNLDFSHNARPLPTLSEAKPFAILLFTVAVLIMGVYYLIINRKFFKGIIADKVFVGNLSDIYRDRILCDERLMARRRFRRYFLLLLIGMVFMYDLTIDAVNVIPDFIGYTLIFTAFLCISKKGSRKMPLMLYLPLMAVSVVSYVFKIYCDMGINHIMGYESHLVKRFEMAESWSAITISSVLTVAENTLFVLLCALIFSYAKKSFEAVCPGELSARAPTVLVSVLALLSAYVYVAPLLTAKFYYDYISDSVVNMKSLMISDGFFIAHNYVGLILIGYTFIMLIYFLKQRKHANFEL